MQKQAYNACLDKLTLYQDIPEPKLTTTHLKASVSFRMFGKKTYFSKLVWCHC